MKKGVKLNVADRHLTQGKLISYKILGSPKPLADGSSNKALEVTVKTQACSFFFVQAVKRGYCEVLAKC